MKKILGVFLLIFAGVNFCFAEELAEVSKISSDEQAEQIIEMTQNKIIVNVQKQPLNEKSHQKIVLKKSWFVLNIQINGKVKVNPITNTYEVQ